MAWSTSSRLVDLALNLEDSGSPIFYQAPNFVRTLQKWDWMGFGTVLPSNLDLDQQTSTLDTHSLCFHRGQCFKDGMEGMASMALVSSQ